MLLFMPVEGAVSAAWAVEADIGAYAMEKGVGIAYPTTLMMALRTVKHLWDVENRNRHAERIAERAGHLYDKLASFIDSFGAVGRAFGQARTAHDRARRAADQGGGQPRRAGREAADARRAHRQAAGDRPRRGAPTTEADDDAGDPWAGGRRVGGRRGGAPRPAGRRVGAIQARSAGGVGPVPFGGFPSTGPGCSRGAEAQGRRHPGGAVRCPFCGNVDTQVKDSRPAEDHAAIRRRRSCPGCGGRFTTYERVQLRDLVVIKSNGRREDFDREKLERSVRIALQKRPIEPERMDQMVSGIVRRLESRWATPTSPRA